MGTRIRWNDDHVTSAERLAWIEEDAARRRLLIALRNGLVLLAVSAYLIGFLLLF